MDEIPLIESSRGTSLWSRLRRRFGRRKLTARVVLVGQLPTGDFLPNNVCNQKYNIITFLPLVLFEEFKFFYNVYFLVMALLQFIPTISIGNKLAYWGPLGFVMCITLLREAILDFRRFWRGREVNQRLYERIVMGETRSLATEFVAAEKLRVGDIVKLKKSDRIPADMILLRTDEATSRVFIRTDQLDGESNWKLRIPLSATQHLSSDAELLSCNVSLLADKPDKDIHSFIGNCINNNDMTSESLVVENTLWSSCVLASEKATGVVIYTGADTRAVMNTPAPRYKVSKFDQRVNYFTIMLFIASIAIAFLMIVLKGFDGPWLAFFTRFVLLFSYIIPISLSVNLTIAKTYISLRVIQTDKQIEGTVMRSVSIPEELGRVGYLLADKTGTLTKNQMVFKKIFLRNRLYDTQDFLEVKNHIMQYHFSSSSERAVLSMTMSYDVYNCVLAMALCHNVSPIRTNIDAAFDADMSSSSMSDNVGGVVEYQASSPDEVALVKWTKQVGVALRDRELNTIRLNICETIVDYEILEIFPFTSETRMMGIIVKHDDEITYYVKGADSAFPDLKDDALISQACDDLSSEGLRTLVIGMRSLTSEDYTKFEMEYRSAQSKPAGRQRAAAEAAAHAALHSLVTPLAVSGVEDTLADHVTQTLHLLKEAGIKIWMLTGDKLESALCIARFLHLGNPDSAWQIASPCVTKQQAYNLLTSFSEQKSINLIIEGETLEKCFSEYFEETVSLVVGCGGVVVARCSPTQKALVADVLRARTRCGVAAVGDGGNDVAMIRQAHIGIGIEGSEGAAAALAGDVSVRRFAGVARLLLLHGRRASLAAASLTMFIVHRGLLISTMQAIFSTVFYFSSVSLYPSILMAAYATLYTVLPVFSLVLDEDIPAYELLRNPRLYKSIPKGRHYSYKTFLIWMAISIFQGALIMFGVLILFNEQWIHIVQISYTALILTELIMVALTITTWHYLMVLAEVISLFGYAATLLLYTSYFDPDFILQWVFWWKVIVITLPSCIIFIIHKFIARRRNR